MAKYTDKYLEFVKSDDDFLGMIAFCCFMKSDLSHLDEFQKIKRKKPSLEEIEAINNNLIEEDKKRYSMQAKLILDYFGKDYIKQHEPIIREKVLKEEIIKSMNFWRQIFATILGAFLYSLVLIGCYVIIHYLGIDMFNLFGNLA